MGAVAPLTREDAEENCVLYGGGEGRTPVESDEVGGEGDV